MLERDSIQSGMSVRGSRGEFFGRVVACGARHFIVRRSVWTRKRAAVSHADVARLHRGMVWLRRGSEALLPEEVTAGEGPLMTVLPLDPSRKTVPEAVASLR